MILNLNEATEENGIYTWRFPWFKFNVLIKTLNLPLGYVVFFKKTEQQVIQLVIPPNFSPSYTFENDHLTMCFCGTGIEMPVCHPTELTVELIEAQTEVIEPVNA